MLVYVMEVDLHLIPHDNIMRHDENHRTTYTMKRMWIWDRFGSRPAHSMLILLPLFQLKIYRHSQILWSSVRGAGL